MFAKHNNKKKLKSTGTNITNKQIKTKVCCIINIKTICTDEGAADE